MMRFRFITASLIGLAIIASSALAASDEHDSELMEQHGHQIAAPSSANLTQAGNDMFGTVQEVIQQMNEQDGFSWKEVNLEVLRQHLLDMQDMTENVEVVGQRPVANGVELHIKATTPRAFNALKRVFSAHPAQLKKETGWEMLVSQQDDLFVLTTTSSNSNDTDKIRGLGYIGLMAWGNHHQPHHWAMATGQNPHADH